MVEAASFLDADRRDEAWQVACRTHRPVLELCLRWLWHDRVYRAILSLPAYGLAATGQPRGGSVVLRFLRERVVEEAQGTPSPGAQDDSGKAVDLLVAYFLQRLQILDALAVQEEAMHPSVQVTPRRPPSPLFCTAARCLTL